MIAILVRQTLSGFEYSLHSELFVWLN